MAPLTALLFALSTAVLAQGLGDVTVTKHKAAKRVGPSYECTRSEPDPDTLKAQRDSAYFFLSRSQPADEFHLCLNKTADLFTSGLYVPGSLAEEGGDLVLDSAELTGTPPVTLRDVMDGKLLAASWISPAATYGASRVWRFRMPLAELAALPADADDTMSGYYWLLTERDPRMPPGAALSFDVRIVEVNPKVIERDLRRAFAMPEVAKSMFADEKSVETIVSFFKKEMGRYGGTEKPKADAPSMQVNLWVDKKNPGKQTFALVAEGAAHASSKTTKSGSGRTVVVTVDEDYDRLVYCYEHAQLEALSVHSSESHSRSSRLP